jgi:hypothetical protein
MRKHLMFASALLVLVIQAPHFSAIAFTDCHKSEFSLPLASGSTFTVQYDCSISDANVQQSNEIVDQYLPKLFGLFWTPAVEGEN